MSALKLGTTCAVFDADGQVLLSHRGDFDIWNLPGGRLDAHEYIWEAAAREVREETGIEVEITNAAALLFSTPVGRLGFVFRARPIGGTLVSETFETRDNRYFPTDELPDSLFRPFLVEYAQAEIPSMHHESVSQEQYRKLQRGLAIRWVKNLLNGHLEPRNVYYEVQATAVLLNADKTQAFTIKGDLPTVHANPEVPPWEMLSNHIHEETNLEVSLQWAGIAQTRLANRVELVFSGTLPNAQAKHCQAIDAFHAKDRLYIQQVIAQTDHQVWFVDPDSALKT